MTKYWCANFENADVLRHGFDISAWLMQYQYPHDDFLYQGGRTQATASWNLMKFVEEGDWLVAYLKENTYFAVGKVIDPEKKLGRTIARNYQVASPAGGWVSGQILQVSGGPKKVRLVPE